MYKSMGKFLLKKFDTDNNSALEFNEFVNMLLYLWELHSRQRVIGCKRRIDANLEVVKKVFTFLDQDDNPNIGLDLQNNHIITNHSYIGVVTADEINKGLPLFLGRPIDTVQVEKAVKRLKGSADKDTGLQFHEFFYVMIKSKVLREIKSKVLSK